MRKARVFISCGQNTPKEKSIGTQVEKYFRERGFDAYFAEEIHSPDSITEYVFRILGESEYFVFIDFKRESISDTEFRGSLFVSQEIGIATFLKIPAVGFVEEGIKREGILDYQIHNPFYFSDVTEIINKLNEATGSWLTDSLNELHLSYKPKNDSPNIKLDYENDRYSDWRHIEVENRNLNRHALACSCYVTKIIRADSEDWWEIPTVELAWSGISDSVVNVLGGSRRDFDAFFLIHDSNEIRFHVYNITTKNPRFNLPVLTPGEYTIEYSVISSNFKLVSSEFSLRFSGGSNEVEFFKVSE